ncbi:MAG: hypothetical protein JKX86_05550 [Verrucomicrobiales bacterium]|jgi:hypothetical protein|nr:hypothetical protein [Verrucomicrobiales bacterium]|tara:strand:- start:559 stop:774 length:216 start_codon:yes stop_codon:yes gene_type:complete
MSQDRKAAQRERRRKEGFKPIEVWLPEHMIAKIDQMKAMSFASRDAVIMALLEDTVGLQRPVPAGDQPALL